MLKVATEAVPAQMRQNVPASHCLLLYWLSLRANCEHHLFFRVAYPARPLSPRAAQQGATTVTGGPLKCEHQGVCKLHKAAAYLGPEGEDEVFFSCSKTSFSPDLFEFIYKLILWL